MIKLDVGSVGLGTLVLFIALILIASATSTLLIRFSDTLQERISDVGSSSIQQVATTLHISTVSGYSATADVYNPSETNYVTDTINATLLIAKVSTGAIDLRYLTLTYQASNLYISGVPLNTSGNVAASLPSGVVYQTCPPATSSGWIFNTSVPTENITQCLCNATQNVKSTWYAIKYLRAVNQPDTYLEKGEVIEILFCITNEQGTPMPLRTNTEWKIKLIPRQGNSVEISGITPNTIQRKWTILYP